MRPLILPAVLLLGAAPAYAAELPCPQLRIVAPYAAGGAADVPARLLAERLEGALKRTVIVENRPGATGNVGTALVAAARPDGCTLLLRGSVLATLGHSFSKLNYDPATLVAVAGVGITPTMLVTAASNPPQDLEELLAWSRQRSDGLSYGVPGIGALQHLAVEELKQRTGANLVQVPYRGGASAATDLVTGRVDFGSIAAGSILQLVKDGKLRALAVVQDKRSALAPAVASTAEQGFPGLNAGLDFLLFAPAGTPGDVMTMLNREVGAIVGDPALRERFLAINFEPTPLSLEEAAAVMRRTAETWVPVITRLGIKLD